MWGGKGDMREVSVTVSGLSPRCGVNFLPCHGPLVQGVGTMTNNPDL